MVSGTKKFTTKSPKKFADYFKEKEMLYSQWCNFKVFPRSNQKIASNIGTCNSLLIHPGGKCTCRSKKPPIIMEKYKFIHICWFAFGEVRRVFMYCYWNVDCVKLLGPVTKSSQMTNKILIYDFNVSWKQHVCTPLLLYCIAWRCLLLSNANSIWA